MSSQPFQLPPELAKFAPGGSALASATDGDLPAADALLETEGREPEVTQALMRLEHQVKDNAAIIEHAPELVPNYSKADRAAMRDYLSSIGQQTPMAGFGAHGSVLGTYETIELRYIAPNPIHPRSDWQVMDDEMKALIRSIYEEDGGIQVPLDVTPVNPWDPEAERGYQVIVFDGMRRYFAARQPPGLTRVPVRVLMDERSGYPLAPSLRALAWLKSNSRKQPSIADVALAIAQFYAFSRELGEQGKNAPFVALPTQQQLASMTGLTQSAISKAFLISDEPDTVQSAIAHRMLPVSAVLKLHAITTPTTREKIADEVMAGVAAGQSPWSVKQITARADELERRVSYATPALATRATAGVTGEPPPPLGLPAGKVVDAAATPDQIAELLPALAELLLAMRKKQHPPSDLQLFGALISDAATIFADLSTRKQSVGKTLMSLGELLQEDAVKTEARKLMRLDH